MAFCVQAPNHYQTLYWFDIKIFNNMSQGIDNGDDNAICHGELVVSK